MLRRLRGGLDCLAVFVCGNRRAQTILRTTLRAGSDMRGAGETSGGTMRAADLAGLREPHPLRYHRRWRRLSRIENQPQ